MIECIFDKLRTSGFLCEYVWELSNGKYNHHENNIFYYIQAVMSTYTLSSVHSEVRDTFFKETNCRYYLDLNIALDVRQRDVYYHELYRPIHDCIAEVFRYNYRYGIQYELSPADFHKFFDMKYKDTYFLEQIEPYRHFVCKRWYDFLIHEIHDWRIVKHLGNTILHWYEYNVLKQSDSKGYAWDECYNAACCYQLMHPEINWNSYYAHDRKEMLKQLQVKKRVVNHIIKTSQTERRTLFKTFLLSIEIRKPPQTRSGAASSRPPLFL